MTNITREQAIDILNRIVPWASDALGHDGKTLTGDEIIAIRDLLNSPVPEHKPSYSDLMRVCQVYQERCGQTLEDTLNGKWTNAREADGVGEAVVQSVPEGWVLVPKEPTDEMACCGNQCSDAGDDVEDVYRAMLKAAPTPPTGKE